jgi:hypothetical protein
MMKYLKLKLLIIKFYFNKYNNNNNHQVVKIGCENQLLLCMWEPPNTGVYHCVGGGRGGEDGVKEGTRLET